MEKQRLLFENFREANTIRSARMSVPSKLVSRLVPFVALLLLFASSAARAQGKGGHPTAASVAAKPAAAKPAAAPAVQASVPLNASHACPNDPSPEGSPTINGLDPGSSVVVTGKLPGDNKAGICVQISISHAGTAVNNIRAEVESDGTFSSVPVALSVGDTVSAKEVTSSTTYGAVSTNAVVGRCSQNVTDPSAPQPRLDPIASLTSVSGTIVAASGITVRVCVDDYEVGRTAVGSNGGFAVRVAAGLAASQKISAQEVIAPAAPKSPEGYGAISATTEPVPAPTTPAQTLSTPTAATATVSTPTAPAVAPTCTPDAKPNAAPTIGSVDAGPSIAISGKLPGTGKGGMCVQVFVSCRRRYRDGEGAHHSGCCADLRNG